MTTMIQHPIDVCEKRLQALPNYSQFHCTPKEFVCACGRHWVHVCDEAEGCGYELAPDVHMPRLLALQFTISSSEARRALAAGAVRLDDEVVRDLDVPQRRVTGRLLRMGTRQQVRLL